MTDNEIPCSISAVIPVYNDRESLARAIPVSLEYLDRITRIFELIITEDASTDGSYELARSWAERDQRIKVRHRDKRLGRGSALNEAVLSATGDIFCYFDVDMATDMTHLSELITSIRKGYDIAIGSRLLKESRITRSPDREMKSRGYNLLVRLCIGGDVRDHQCGFKAFNRMKLLELLPSIQDTHWFWDTELLAYAERRGYRIKELPVVWKEGPGTTVKTRDILLMGRSILGLRLRLLRESRTPPSPDQYPQPSGGIFTQTGFMHLK
ncbi:MAG: glycosyltransferase family 2 protein [Methanospirillum sp.]|nr:glycosyltransferase family 2 protein [Methanospirillum sp.]